MDEPRITRRRSWTSERRKNATRTGETEFWAARGGLFSPRVHTAMRRNTFSMPSMWEAFEADQRQEEGLLWSHVSRTATTTSPPLPASPLTAPAAMQALTTPSSRMTPLRPRKISDANTPPSQAGTHFALPLSPITPSASAVSSARAAAAAPCARRTPAAAAAAATRCAPRRLASMPSAPTAPSSSRGEGGWSAPEPAAATAFSSSFGDILAAACMVGWSEGGGDGGGGRRDRSEGDVEEAAVANAGDAGWDFRELDYGVDREEVAGRPSSLRLLKIFGSKTGLDDAEGNYETGDDHCDDLLVGSPHAPVPHPATKPHFVVDGLIGLEQQQIGFRPAGSRVSAAAAAGAEHGDQMDNDTDDEAPALPMLMNGDGSLISKGDEDAGAGGDREVLLEPAGGDVDGAAELVTVTTPPRLTRLRVAADGSVVESTERRRPPLQLRQRRIHIRQQRRGEELQDGAARGDPPAATGGGRHSERIDVQRTNPNPVASLGSSDDDEEAASSSSLDRVPPRFLQEGRKTGGTPGGVLKTPSGAVRTPTGGILGEEGEGDGEGEEGGAREVRQEARGMHARRKSAPTLSARRRGSSSFAVDLVHALEVLHQSSESEESEEEEERQHRLLRHLSEADAQRGDRADTTFPAALQPRRGRDKQRSSSIGKRPWSRSTSTSRSRGRALGTTGGFAGGVVGAGSGSNSRLGSAANSRRGSGTSGGGGSILSTDIFGKIKGGGGSGANSRRGSGINGGGSSIRGTEIFGKIKGILSLEFRPSPARRPMTRIEQHKAHLRAEAFHSPGTRHASSFEDDNTYPDDEPLEGEAKQPPQAGGRKRGGMVPGWRPRGVGGGGCRTTVVQLKL